MSPSPSQGASATSDLRQMARLPQDSDGVGDALRQVFAKTAGLPVDFSMLLSRLNKEN